MANALKAFKSMVSESEEELQDASPADSCLLKWIEWHKDLNTST